MRGGLEEPAAGSRRTARGWRLPRVLLLVAASLVLLTAILAVAATLILQDRRLAAIIERRLPSMQGRVQLAGVRWTPRGALALLRGRAAHLTVDGLRVLDPEGTLVLDVPHAEIDVEAHDGALIVHGAELGRVAWHFAAMRTRPGIGFLAAFAPPETSRPDGAQQRPAMPAGHTSPTVDVRGVRWDDLDATFDFPVWGLVLRGVHGGGSLRAGPPGAGIATFLFDAGGVARRGGRLRIMPKPEGVELSFDHVVLPHVGIRPERPEDLHIQVTDARTGTSQLHGSGYFTGLFSRSPLAPSGIDVDLAFEHAADVLAAVLRERGVHGAAVSGTEARVAASLRGPYRSLRASLTTSGLELEMAGRRLRDISLHVDGRTGPPSLMLSSLRFRTPGGGTLEAAGSLTAQRARVTLRAAGVALRPWLPAPLAAIAGEHLDALAAITADPGVGAARLEALDATLRPPGATAPIVVRGGRALARPPPPGATLVKVHGLHSRHGQLVLDRLALAGRAGELTVSGRAGPRAGERTPLHLSFRAERIDLGRLLHSPALSGRIAGRGTASGTTGRLAFTAAATPDSTLRILGEPYRLPDRLDLTVIGQRVRLPVTVLTSPGGARLTLGGDAAPSGIDLAVTLDGHPLARLPWIVSARLPVTGTVGGVMRLRGPPPRPHPTGDVLLRRVTIAGVPLGDGVLQVTPRNDALELAGRLFDRFGVDGTLALGPQGPAARLRLAFADLALPALLPRLRRVPGLTALASGTVTGTIAPEQPPTLELALSALALSYDVAGPRGPERATVRSETAVRVRATAEPAALELEPLRLRTDAGPLDLSLRVAAGQLDAALRGSIDLALLQPLVGRAGPGMSGVLQASLRAGGTPLAPAINGAIRVATPLHIPALDATVATGMVTLAPAVAGTEVAARDVSVRVAGAGPFVLGGSGAAPARIVVRRFAPLGLGAIDVPLRARDLRLGAGNLRVGDMDVDIRLRGDARRRLAITGEVAVAGAALRGKLPARPGSTRPIRLHPLLARASVDLHLHSSDGGVLVERRFIPDFRIQVDAHVVGTVARPRVSYTLASPDYVGRLALQLYELYRLL